MAPLKPSITKAQAPRRRMSDQLKFRIWEFAEWITKLAIVAIFGLLWQQNANFAVMASTMNEHEKQIAELKGEMAAVKAGYMSRVEVLEALKRVEQNQQIMLLQFQLDAKRSKKP